MRPPPCSILIIVLIAVGVDGGGDSPLDFVRDFADAYTLNSVAFLGPEGSASWASPYYPATYFIMGNYTNELVRLIELDEIDLVVVLHGAIIDGFLLRKLIKAGLHWIVPTKTFTLNELSTDL